MDCKEGQFGVVEVFNINLNAQHVNEMTYFGYSASPKSFFHYERPNHESFHSHVEHSN